jgi:alkaline phosphatase D
LREHVGDEIYTLDEYRRRYAQYKTDPDLQAAHASAAFLSSFDDHEVDNNWAGDDDQDATPRELFRLRRFAAMQAWYENMPVRRAQFPTAGLLRMHRRIDYGDLIRVHVLDTRQYRSGQICGAKAGDRCLPIADPSRPSIIGPAQQAWIEEGLGNHMRWNLLAQQVMVMPLLYPPSRTAGRTNLDSWSGYPASRERLARGRPGDRSRDDTRRRAFDSGALRRGAGEAGSGRCLSQLAWRPNDEPAAIGFPRHRGEVRPRDAEARRRPGGARRRTSVNIRG